MSRAVVPIHGTDHRRAGPDPIPARAILHIKLFPDEDMETLLTLELPVTTGEDLFVFPVAWDMAGLALTRLEASVSTVSSSGTVQVNVRNRTQAVMLGIAQVDAGEPNSRTAATQPVANDFIYNEWADEIAIDVATAGTGAHGLGVILEFS